MIDTKKKKKKNLMEIADIAGVSLTTVSRVFSNHPYVKEATRNKIMNAARKINYEPKIPVSKRNIGVVVESLQFIHKDRYLSTFLSYIAKELSDNSLGIELIPIKELYKFEENFINTAIAILYLDESIKEIKRYKKINIMRNKKINIIMINNIVDGFSCVCSDHRQGINLAYNHLKDNGHKNIALFMDYLEGWGSLERKNVFMELNKQNNFPENESLLKSSSPEKLSQSIREVIDAGATGVIISSENAILRVVSEITRQGKTVTDDLSIVSFEDQCVSKYLYPAQTTVCQGFDEVVRNAVKLADQSLNNKLKKPVKIILENNLIVRDSVKQLKSN